MRPFPARPTAPLALSVFTALGACGGGGASESGAADAFEESLSALENGKVSAFIQSSTSKVQLDEMKADWDKERQALPNHEAAAQFREVMTMLTAKDAEQQIFGMLQPKLAAFEEQAAGVADMLPMFTSGFSGQQAAPAVDALTEVADRLPDLGIQDEKKLKQAISIVTGTARKLDVKDFDALAKLDFSGLLAKSDVLYAGATDLLEVYGLSVEESLGSTEVTVQSASENEAVLAVSYSLFGGRRQSTNIGMARVDGRWVPTGR